MKNIIGLFSLMLLVGCGSGTVVRSPSLFELEAGINRKKALLERYKADTAKKAAELEAQIAHEERMAESYRQRERERVAPPDPK